MRNIYRGPFFDTTNDPEKMTEPARPMKGNSVRKDGYDVLAKRGDYDLPGTFSRTAESEAQEARFDQMYGPAPDFDD